MAYCRNCGKEIDEKAVICIGCGVPVSDLSMFALKKSIQETVAETAPKEKLVKSPWTFWLSMFTYVCGLVSFILLIHSVVFMSISDFSGNYYTISLAAPYEPLLLGALIMSCITFASAIGSFAVGVSHTVKKALSETEYYMYIIALALGVATFISGMCAYLI